MKLPKVLLGAILAGISIQALSSCSKKETQVFPLDKKGNITDVIKPQPQEPFNCPGCGMG